MFATITSDKSVQIVPLTIDSNLEVILPENQIKLVGFYMLKFSRCLLMIIFMYWFVYCLFSFEKSWQKSVTALGKDT